MSQELQTNKFSGRKIADTVKKQKIKAKKANFKKSPELRLFRLVATVISDCHKGDYSGNLEDKHRLTKLRLLDAVEDFIGLKITKIHPDKNRRRRYGLIGKARRDAGEPHGYDQVVRHWPDNFYYDQPEIGKHGQRKMRDDHPINTHRELYEEIKREFLKKGSRSARCTQLADESKIKDWLARV